MAENKKTKEEKKEAKKESKADEKMIELKVALLKQKGNKKSIRQEIARILTAANAAGANNK